MATESFNTCKFAYPLQCFAEVEDVFPSFSTFSAWKHILAFSGTFRIISSCRQILQTEITKFAMVQFLGGRSPLSRPSYLVPHPTRICRLSPLLRYFFDVDHMVSPPFMIDLRQKKTPLTGVAKGAWDLTTYFVSV